MARTSLIQSAPVGMRGRNLHRSESAGPRAARLAAIDGLESAALRMVYENHPPLPPCARRRAPPAESRDFPAAQVGGDADLMDAAHTAVLGSFKKSSRFRAIPLELT